MVKVLVDLPPDVDKKVRRFMVGRDIRNKADAIVKWIERTEVA